MATTQIKERSFKSSSRESTQKAPFCQEVRDFIAESCKVQTLYAKCEGFYNRRVVSYEKKQLLKEFIFNFMYYNEDNEPQSQSNSDEMIHATQICNKMISLSKQYNPDDVIQFSAVWVYYFEYELKVKKATPVFKIFKRKSGSEAVFLDVHLKSYENWDCYLENAEFKESFLCVPRHGEYHFDPETKMLVLEYLRSMKLKTSNKKDLFYTLFKAPFSQTSVRSLFTKVATCRNKIVEQIKWFLHVLSNYWVERKDSMFNSIIFFINIVVKAKGSENTVFETMSKLAFMLLDVHIETTEIDDCSNLLKHLINQTTAFIPEFSSLSSEGSCFIKLLLSSEKNWLEILKSFCLVFRNCRSIIILASRIAPNSWIINYLFWLLILIEKIFVPRSDSYESSKTENCSPKIKTDYPKTEFNSSGPSFLNLRLSHCMSNSSSSALDNKDVKPSAVDSETQDSVVQLKHVSYEEILSNLPSLETVSSDRSFNLLFEKSRFLEKVQPSPIDVSPADLGILVKKINGYGIYLFPKVSIPLLPLSVKRLLKANFSFKPREIFSQEIISDFGETLGFIFFPLEFTAVGLFPLKEMVEEEKEKESLL